MPAPASVAANLAILAVTQAHWGERIAENIERHHPENWAVHRWAAPRVLPAIIDEPEDYLPASLPAVDLVLALGDSPGVAALIPDLVRRCGARAVIAPIDRNESLPAGLARQLHGWLAEMGVAAVFPRPFCSLTETTYNRAPAARPYADPLIRAFAAAFGRPEFQVSLDGQGCIQAVAVARDTACGCGRRVAAGLAGCRIAQAVEQAGLLHHHHPCLASMNQDAEYRDTLMHVSGGLMRAAVQAELAGHVEQPYLRPGGRVDD